MSVAVEQGEVQRIPRKVIGLGVLVALSIGLCVLSLAAGWVEPQSLPRAVARSGSAGFVVFIVLSMVLELLWLPRMWVIMAGALLFGPFVGAALSLVGDTASAMICYFVARGAGRDWVCRRLASRPKARQVMGLLAVKRGALSMVVLRVVPIAHYTLVSYLAGVTGVKPKSFVIGNTVGLVPGAVLYALVGGSLFEPSSPAFIVSMGVLVVAFVATAVGGKRFFKSVA